MAAVAKKPRKKMELSDEERKRRSELAKKQHEAGVFGGKQEGAGRPKNKRASEIVAEGIKDDAQKILTALRAALKSDSDATKLKAALAMIDIENKETELRIKEEQRAYDNLDRQQLLNLVKERLDQLKESGTDMGDIIDAKATEILPKELTQ
jgi:hypothetical protein